ncbi:MAG: DUF2332 family protein [Dehalococcoidia bacterium]|nr:DUF2332 family protein [Dehalococcoidia bacterium]
MPAVASRLGIDLYPVSPGDADGVRWLRALVWPDHRERANRLDQAVPVAVANPPQMVAGDALRVLPDLVHAIPAEAVPVVYHSHTLAHFTAEARQHFVEDLLPGLGRQRNLMWLACEGSRMDLTVWRNGARTDRELARRDPHGAWLEWRDRT